MAKGKGYFAHLCAPLAQTTEICVFEFWDAAGEFFGCSRRFKALCSKMTFLSLRLPFLNLNDSKAIKDHFEHNDK